MLNRKYVKQIAFNTCYTFEWCFGHNIWENFMVIKQEFPNLHVTLILITNMGLKINVKMGTVVCSYNHNIWQTESKGS